MRPLLTHICRWWRQCCMPSYLWNPAVPDLVVSLRISLGVCVIVVFKRFLHQISRSELESDLLWVRTHCIRVASEARFFDSITVKRADCWIFSQISDPQPLIASEKESEPEQYHRSRVSQTGSNQNPESIEPPLETTWFTHPSFLVQVQIIVTSCLANKFHS